MRLISISIYLHLFFINSLRIFAADQHDVLFDALKKLSKWPICCLGTLTSPACLTMDVHKEAACSLLLLIFANIVSMKTRLSVFSLLDSSIVCAADLFRCDIVQCLPYAFVCNGEYNCQDRTDEMNCSTAIINNNLCNTNHSINCEQDILHSTRLIDHDIHFEYTRPVQICIQRWVTLRPFVL